MKKHANINDETMCEMMRIWYYRLCDGDRYVSASIVQDASADESEVRRTLYAMHPNTKWVEVKPSKPFLFPPLAVNTDAWDVKKAKWMGCLQHYRDKSVSKKRLRRAQTIIEAKFVDRPIFFWASFLFIVASYHVPLIALSVVGLFSATSALLLFIPTILVQFLLWFGMIVRVFYFIEDCYAHTTWMVAGKPKFSLETR